MFILLLDWGQLLVAAIQIVAHTISDVNSHVVTILTHSIVLLCTHLELCKLFLRLAIIHVLLALPGNIKLLCLLLIRPLFICLHVN